MNFEQIKNKLKKSMDYKEKADLSSENFDPMGSYTGTPEDDYDRPVQDADDL